jgi:hypothetical protein
VTQKSQRCSNCKEELSGAFCASCGVPAVPRRINGHYLLAEIGSILYLDRGILYTIRELLLRPGSSIRNYLLKNRNRLIKPVFFIIICSLVYTLLQQWLNFEDGYVNYSFKGESAAMDIFTWISQNYGYANLLMAVFMAFWIRVFFRKSGYNFFEILILLCYAMGMSMLFFALFGILDAVTGISIIGKGYFIGIIYASWAIGQFFNGKVLGFIKGFMSYMLGIFTFSLVVLALGLMIEILLK